MRPNKIAQGASNTQPAKLPAINIPATADPALRQALEAIKERLEVREGARGNPYERVVTLRDLDGLGLSAGSSSSSSASASAAATRLGAGAGNSSPGRSLFSNDEEGDIRKTISALQQDIRNGALYGALGSGIDTKRINSVIEDLKQRVEGVRSELDAAVDGVSRKLSAYAGSETTARTTADSATAKQVSALQAAFNSNVASVLKEQDVLASETQAVARDVTTLAARLDNSDGTGVSIEQRAEAVEDKTNGLRGQYTVKIDANGYVSGFGLASAAPIDGSPYSEFAVRADRFYIANPTLKTESMPFIVQTTSKVIDGKTIPPGVYIDDAFIGKLSADKIDARGLVIKDSAGKTILGAGTALDWGLISGADKPQDGATRNVFKGQWLSAMEYTVGDVLLFAGNSWVATISHTSSDANKPPSSATGTSDYWAIYAARGDVGQGMVKGVAFKRSKTTPAAPAASEGSFTSPNPSSASGWSDGVPPGTDPLYMSTRIFTSDGLSPQQNAWTAPQLVSALGKGIRVQFSTNGTSGWSTTPSENSVYMRVQTSEDGGITWVTDSNGVVKIKGEAGDSGQGAVKGIAFKRSKTTPAAPAASEGSFTSPNPSSASGWSDGVPPGTDPLYMSTRIFTSDGLSPQQNAWTAPQLVSALGKGIRVQFSTNGTSGWSTTPSENSVYMRVQTSEDGGKTWVTDSNGVVKIKGEAGDSGQGAVKGIAFYRGTTAPSAPTGGSFNSPTPTTAGWSDGVPSGTAPLWQSTRLFTSDGASPQQGAWTAPQKVANTSSVKYEFSTNNSTWSSTASTDSIYMRALTSADGGATWTPSDGVKIKGEAGSYVIYQYAVNTSATTAPDDTATWSSTPSTLSDGQYQWMRAGTVVPPSTTPDSWGTPYRVTGEKGKHGARGSAVGYASSASDAAFKTATGFDAQQYDQLIVTNSTDGSRIYTRGATADSWTNRTALTVNGDAIIDGTLAVKKLTSGSSTIGGGTFGLGYTSVFKVGGQLYSGVVYGQGSSDTHTGGLFYSEGGTALRAVSLGDDQFGATILNMARDTTTKEISVNQAVAQLASRSQGGQFELRGNSTTNNPTHVRAICAGNAGTSTNPNYFAFYAANLATSNPSTTQPWGRAYLPQGVVSFTGAHEALISKDQPVEAGDIVADVRVVLKNDVSNAFTVVEAALRMSKAAVGVYTGDHTVITYLYNGEPFDLDKTPKPEYADLIDTHDQIFINSVGEGLINVCGENGDLEPGDLITTSSMPGKGMRQDDDLIRNYTVAKCREHVKFSQPNEVKQVACIYLCG